MTAAGARDDRVLPATRVAAVLVTLVLLGAAVTLYGWPADTARLFAWTINPPMTALFMGAGYAFGAYFWCRTIFAARWHHVGHVFLPITLFAWMMLIATLLHWDRFNHAHVWFHVWLATYVVTPVLVPLLWYYNRRTDPGAADPGDVETPPGLRWFLAIAGAIQLAVGLALFLLPHVLTDLWPWQLTPFTARIVGGWYATAGLAGIVLSGEKRWSGGRVIFQGSMIWLALLLIGVLRAWPDLDPGNPLTWIYVGSLCLFLVIVAGFYLMLESRRRRMRNAVAHVGPGMM